LQAGTEGKHVNRLAQWAAGQGHHFGLNHYPHHGLTGLKSLRRSVKVGGYGEERFWKSRTEAYVDLLRWCIRQRELVKICFDQPPPVLAEIELRARYPGVYGPGGFFDAVNPTTGSVGHRYLVLDQSMIMAALDNALNDRGMQRHFAQDPVSWAAQEYLGAETMSLR